MNTLHFFWLQGEEDLKSYRPDLYETQFDWIDNHPHFNVMYWDFGKLNTLVNESYPQYKDVWLDIQNSDFNQRHIYCKMMDFTKFLVFHRYGGFFIDRDLHYRNSIVELMEYGGVVCSERVIEERFMSSDIGKKMYSQVSGYEFLLQDCFIGFQKESDFCIEFVEWCLKNNRKMSGTLDAFSVFSLTDYYNEDSKRFDNINILPEHKSVFNVEYCIENGWLDESHANDVGYCYHTFESTWMDRSADEPWNA